MSKRNRKNIVNGNKRMGPVTHSELRVALRNFERQSRELKYGNPITSGSYSNAGAVVQITQGIIQGATAQTRDGNSINVKEVDVTWQSALAAASGQDWVRMIVFIDRFANGVYPAVSEILMSPATSSPLEKANFITHRFKILFDKVIPMSSGGNSKVTSIRKKIKLNNHHVEFLAATSLQSANGPGAMYYLLLGDAASNQSTLTVNAAVKFYDA
jgi:hypothetical protein